MAAYYHEAEGGRLTCPLYVNTRRGENIKSDSVSQRVLRVQLSGVQRSFGSVLTQLVSVYKWRL